MKLVLTSNGFENKIIGEYFIKMINKSVENIKVLFVPTAAIDEQSKAILSECITEIVQTGIKLENIHSYNCDIPISVDEISKYDVLYFAGGSTKYLYKQICKIEFDKIIKTCLNYGIVYVGVSAGSIVADKYHLNLVHRKISVHCKKGHKNAKIHKYLTVKIKDLQALIIDENKTFLIE